MKEFIVTDGSNEFKFKLPTNIKEITSDYLKAVTDHIIVAPYHAVIATIYRCKLPEVISTNKKSRAMAVAIVPVFVKANLEGTLEDGCINMFNQINTGDKIIIAGTDIERGYQMSTPNNFITMDTVIRIYNNPNNKENFNSKIMADQTYYYFVDFKMVPITDIKGKYVDAGKLDSNPFTEIIINENTAN